MNKEEFTEVLTHYVEVCIREFINGVHFTFKLPCGCYLTFDSAHIYEDEDIEIRVNIHDFDGSILEDAVIFSDDSAKLWVDRFIHFLENNPPLLLWDTENCTATENIERYKAFIGGQEMMFK